MEGAWRAQGLTLLHYCSSLVTCKPCSGACPQWMVCACMSSVLKLIGVQVSQLGGRGGCTGGGA